MVPDHREDRAEGEGSRMFFEEHPLFFIVVVLVVVEGWIRIRGRVFSSLRQLARGKRPS
jgi:hypothetical protein